MDTPQLENGFTKIANEILEKLSQTYISANEWQVLIVILRRTYGFNKKSDWISNSQFSEATGIAKSNVTRVLNRLEKKRIVIRTDNTLSFNKNYAEWEDKKLSEQITPKKLSKQITKVIQTDNKVIQTDNKKLSEQIPTKEIKENIQNKYINKYIETYNELFKKTTKPTKGREKKLQLRLKVFTFDEILIALNNLGSSDWHRGNNDRGWIADPDFLIRNDEQIDKWLNYQKVKNKGGQNGGKPTGGYVYDQQSGTVREI